MITAADITGIILCGGQARRMSGVDKPLQPLCGKPMVGHVLERLRPQVAHVVISANRNVNEYAALGAPVVADTIADAGPLAGVLAAVGASSGTESGASLGEASAGRTSAGRMSAGKLSTDDSLERPWLFVCPGDAPLLHPTLVARLAEQLERPGTGVAAPHDGARLQHLFLLFPTSLCASIETYLGSGHRSVHGWLASQQVHEVDASDIALSFRNINTIDELNAASRELHASDLRTPA